MISLMTDSATKLLQEALHLPENVRAGIAAELIASLDRDRDEEVQRAWATEISQRADAVRRGDLKGEDWRPILDAIEREVLSR
jgi:hypothetical protein